MVRLTKSRERPVHSNTAEHSHRNCAPFRRGDLVEAGSETSLEVECFGVLGCCNQIHMLPSPYF